MGNLIGADKMVTKTGLVAGLTLCVMIALGLSGMMYGAYVRGQSKQDINIEKVTNTSIETKINVIKMQSDLEHIKDKVDASENTQQKILDKIDDLKDEIRNGRHP